MTIDGWQSAIVDLAPVSFGTARGLLGGSWATYYRVLHPAYHRAATAAEFVPWRAVAASTGRRLTVASSTWAEVAGVEPHTAELPPGVDGEPVEGPAEPDLQRLLVQTLVDAAGDVGLAVARWSGYGSEDVPLDADRLVVHRERYDIVETTPGRFPLPGWLGNYVAGDSGRWLLCADIDCMSTYVATTRDVRPAWPQHLEVATCDPDVRIS